MSAGSPGRRTCSTRPAGRCGHERRARRAGMSEAQARTAEGRDHRPLPVRPVRDLPALLADPVLDRLRAGRARRARLQPGALLPARPAGARPVEGGGASSRSCSWSSLLLALGSAWLYGVYLQAQRRLRRRYPRAPASARRARSTPTSSGSPAPAASAPAGRGWSTRGPWPRALVTRQLRPSTCTNTAQACG